CPKQSSIKVSKQFTYEYRSSIPRGTEHLEGRSNEDELSRLIKQRAIECGFDLVGIIAAARPETFDHFADGLRQGLHGTMDYLPRRESAYAHPEGVLPSVRSIIVAGMCYDPPDEKPHRRDDGRTRD